MEGKSDAPEKRGNTNLDALTDDIKFDMFFGCAPSVGVKSDTKFIADICNELLDRIADDMTLTFPEFLEGIKGTDNNFELVSSSTARPVKLMYTFNLVSKLLGYWVVSNKFRCMSNLIVNLRQYVTRAHTPLSGCN